MSKGIANKIKEETYHKCTHCGDGDFADPIRKLISAGKKVYLFATAGRISSELNELRESGLNIVDIFELKEFICWLKESAYKRTKDPVAEAL